MEQINFTKKVNLEELASFAKVKNFDNEILLRQAFNKGFLVDKKKILLEKFIDHFRNKKNIKSQLYQDVFASFIIGNKFDKTFLEFGATNGLDLSNTFMLESSFGWKGVLGVVFFLWMQRRLMWESKHESMSPPTATQCENQKRGVRVIVTTRKPSHNEDGW